MIASWMIYSIVVGALAALAARAVERVARGAALPSRWIWLGAMALTAGLSTRAALSRPVHVTLPMAVIATAEPSSPAAVPSAWDVVVQRAGDFVRASLHLPSLMQRLAGVTRLQLVNSYVLGGWAACSVVLALLFVVVHMRYRRARGQWPRSMLHGVPVCIAHNTGPVVLGLTKPDVIVPRWLLERTPDEQRLVVLHEAEHVQARDPLVLAIAWLATMAAPWNAVFWYMLTRLRLAIEVDCDARVLQSGATPERYGALLIDVAERTAGLSVSALALSDDASHLHQRILAMVSRRSRFAHTRGAAAMALGALALLAACETTMLSPQRIDPNDPAAMERAGKQLARIKDADPTHYLVDSVQVAPQIARSLDPERVASIDVQTNPAGQSTVSITTRKKPIPADSLPRRLGRTTRDSTPGTRIVVDGRHAAASAQQLKFFLNGVEVDSASLYSQIEDRNKIASVEVIKGAAAEALYHVLPGTGVISVRTKN